ncbi:MAG: FAD-binding protein [Chitinophagales bacterium]|nr:FAD-binding protein [Chitinophagales bacterium]
MSILQANLSLTELSKQLAGTLHDDELTRRLYATDASVYREVPMAVVYPKDKNDLRLLINFAEDHQIPLTMRAGGTSLGGQVIGSGIIVDISRHFTEILELNVEEKWVRVQPGVIRDDLNRYLKPHGLMFSPETSTANRANVGGMMGNNSCGANSIVYGDTRKHVLEAEVFLSDGALVKFGAISQKQLEQKLIIGGIEGDVYRQIYRRLNNDNIAERIRKEFPKASVHRRNTGYALDALLDMKPFNENGENFNFCKLLTGSEGTLAITTEIKLNLVPLPPEHRVLVCVHFNSLDESLNSVVVAMKHRPAACELIDKIVLDCSKDNIEQNKNRFFIDGAPQAVLCIEFQADTQEKAENRAQTLIDELKDQNWGYSYPLVHGADINRVWTLRKAGLGVLANIPGDRKAVAVIEDTAVAVEDLPSYIADFSEMIQQFHQEVVYYAHAGAGELHLRPVLDLKSEKDRKDFRAIAEETAKLVKKYNGSLSGEHGDGRVRGEFIPMMIGAENYELLREIKRTWDPLHIFNPGKITDTPPMDESMRYESGQVTKQFDTIMSFDKEGGMLRAAEKCNGSGDCRKSPEAGGTMCPSYQATRNEKDTTRARANVLREYLTHADSINPFDQEEIHEVLDLCLSCKGCTAECPSGVDIPKLKTEFLHQYYKTHGVPVRAKMFAYISKLNEIGSFFPRLTNFMLTNPLMSAGFKKTFGIAAKRNLPTLYKFTLEDWVKKNKARLQDIQNPRGFVFFFIDEFTNYNDVNIGIKAIELLYRLGYIVNFLDHPESGRAAISKGLLPHAKECAIKNFEIFSPWVTSRTPLLGIEPSSIFTFRDEYPRLVDRKDSKEAERMGRNCILVEEFIYKEFMAGKIKKEDFTTEAKHIKLLGHCHQKSLSFLALSVQSLRIPLNYKVEIINAGCCGMAGSFGYEAEHYDVSMDIGELILFPEVRKSSADTIIASAGTSCRHQIKDGTDRDAVHPVEILFDALV